MKATTLNTIELAGQKVEYRIIPSKSARKLRVRVGVGGVEVVQPTTREPEEIEAFLQANAEWVKEQLKRIERFRSVRRPQRSQAGEILYRGQATPVRVERNETWRGANRVAFGQDGIVIVRGSASGAPPSKSLENWLRKQARLEIEREIEAVTRKLKRSPRKVYVMDQRTKWGNCSARQNLSFNWRLVLAPDFVLRYLVTHEAVHLAIPDHSRTFWLTVQSLCPETEKARQWLSANSHQLQVDLNQVCAETLVRHRER